MDFDFSEFLSDSDEEEFQQVISIYVNSQNNGFLKKIPLPQRISNLKGRQYVIQLLNSPSGFQPFYGAFIQGSATCYDLLRMTPQIFINLCEEFKKREKLKESKFISIQEQLAMFLLILSHNWRQRVVVDRFQHSLDSVHRHFRMVLYAISSLSNYYITPPSFDETPPEIKNNPRYYPVFKNCVGAIDGTHVSARVPGDQQIPYRGKKVETTMNVMCACSFDMRFTFVMVGWEGTANDSRIFWEILANREENNFPMPPIQKYYILDSGFSIMPGFVTPYRGERYHLRDYRGLRNPQGLEEMFNYTHSSLRNVIERCFRVLKARFPILRDMSPYDLKRQKYIVLCCCTIHSFINMSRSGDHLLTQYGDENVLLDEENGNATSVPKAEVVPSICQSEQQRMARFRDRLATQLWERHTSE